ncbi:putative CFEM domain-containing protein [Colletotrichum sublineola]|uniref:Putative CFEM domain-containing protein n=1 Tax=Colletotrichum sublineola TaxID=1173701 RepID=A0A066X5H7_COLSU|nr:putative CFEM domain-containing protein [Colletotrichum sublineola]
MVAVRISALLACFFMLGSIVRALDPTPPQVLPPCAVQCTLQELGQTICSVTDQTCMCNDRVFCGYVQSCIFANCTVKEMLVAKNYTSTLCNDPVAKKDNVIPSIQMALFMFTTLVIITRIGHKCMRISPWGWDDTTIMIAYLAFAALTPVGFVTAVAGAGRDVWYLSASQISLGLRMFFISTFLYVLGLAFIKASILFLYLRIFPDHRFRMVLWFTQAFNLLLYISFLITALVSCQPLHYAWEGWTGETEGRCYSTNPPALSHGALNFILDVWMLLLPASQIYKLNVPLKQKLDVMSMFSMGIFLTAVSGYRIKVIRPFGAFLDSDGQIPPTLRHAPPTFCPSINVASSLVPNFHLVCHRARRGHLCGLPPEHTSVLGDSAAKNPPVHAHFVAVAGVRQGLDGLRANLANDVRDPRAAVTRGHARCIVNVGLSGRGNGKDKNQPDRLGQRDSSAGGRNQLDDGSPRKAVRVAAEGGIQGTA